MLTVTPITFEYGKKGGKILVEKTNFWPIPNEIYGLGLVSKRDINYSPEQIAKIVMDNKKNWNPKKGPGRKGHYHFFIGQGIGGINVNVHPPTDPPYKFAKVVKEQLEQEKAEEQAAQTVEVQSIEVIEIEEIAPVEGEENEENEDNLEDTDNIDNE